MFCPRCGRPVNAEANFCGGCGLSRIEIEKYIKTTALQQPEAEAPQQEPAEPAVSEPVFAESEAVKTAEPVFAEPESVKAEEPSFAQTEAAAETAQQPSYTDNNCTYAYSYKKESDTKTENQHSYTSAAADAAYTAPQPAAEESNKETPLSTVDFIWMFIISSLPVIGLVYLIYLAVQDNNINKRSFARATLIVSIFSIVIAVVFAVGVVAAGLF